MIDLRLVSSLPIKWQRLKCACLALTRTPQSLSKICYMAKCSSNKKSSTARHGLFFCLFVFFFIPVFCSKLYHSVLLTLFYFHSDLLFFALLSFFFVCQFFKTTNHQRSARTGLLHRKSVCP